MTDKQKRDAAVDAFAAAMKARLDEKAADGFTGWDGEYPIEHLCDEIAGGATGIGVCDKNGSPWPEQDAIDIGNRAMFLWYRSCDNLIRCAHCGGCIHKDSLAAILKTMSGPSFYCDSPSCVKALASTPHFKRSLLRIKTP